MSVTVTKADGVTVVTMTTKSEGSWPLFCQLLSALCYNPLCCSVSQQLRRLQASTQTILGTMQIMVGLLNIGLGAILISIGSRPLMYNVAPYWLCGVFIAVGIMCVLAGRFPSPCLVGISVLVNMAGAVLAITGIVFYSLDLADVFLYRMCQNDYYDGGYYNDGYGHDRNFGRLVQTPIKQVAVMLLKALDIVLLILAVLQLCLTVSSAVMSLKALCCKNKQEGKEGVAGVEFYHPLLEDANAAAMYQGVPGVEYKPQLEEVTTTNPAA